MANTSDEFHLETIFIGLLNQDTVLAAIGAHHFEDDTANTLTRLIVQATKGDARYDGVGGHDYEVTVTYCMCGPGAAALSDVINRIDAAIEDPDTTGVNLTWFDYLRIEKEGGGSQRDQSDEERTDARVFPVIARVFGGIPANALLDEDGTPILDEDGNFIILV